ncbi:MAG TPA: phosphoribosyl-ATP pyrophosphohydrolase [Devosia sp.]|jgi:NTP pyrophosphatase (non-canonical NTP hydrolase)|uniref:phosphoribosyl-ATP pyrophosphohydrolase n=1 Tax=Devosia sp. TaxID=1871048 RepID=UPI002F93EB40
MTGQLSALTDALLRVSDRYAELFDIRRDDDWFILKLQEEQGELTAEVLRATGRGRLKGASGDDVRTALEDETADVLAMLLLFARHNGVDLDAALQRKWLSYLPPQG